MNRVYAVEIGPLVSFGKNFPTVASLVNVLTKNAVIFAGIIAFIFVIMGGFGIILGAGSGDPKQMEQGKKTLTMAIVGLIVVVFAFWIIQLIGYVLGTNILPMTAPTP